MTLAEHIKDAITMTDILQKYGFELDHGKRMLCPFHDEKTASFLVHRNNKSWKCYGCGAGGTVIDFVMMLYDIGFGQATVRLSSDFGIYAIGRQSMAEASRIRSERFKRQREERKRNDAYSALIDEYRELTRLQRYLEEVMRNNPGNDTALPLLVETMTRINILEQHFDYYDVAGEAEWWKLYNNLQKKTS